MDMEVISYTTVQGDSSEVEQIEIKLKGRKSL